MQASKHYPFWQRTVALVLFFYLGGTIFTFNEWTQWARSVSTMQTDEWASIMGRLIGFSLTFTLLVPVALSVLCRNVKETDRFILCLLASSALGWEVATRAVGFWQTSFFGHSIC